MPSAPMDRLRERVRGQMVTPADAGYDEARRVYNAMIDRRPAVVVRCVDAADVMAAVDHARDHGMDLSVRGGSHSVPGFGTNDGGVVVDLSRMRGVRVDPLTHTARAEGGCTWGDFDHATHAFGLATTGGIVSSTGIGGLTLGGGIGYLARRFGLTVDNLESVDVVTAAGRQVVASDKSHEDLFWAVRGGGGNFGVVTSFEYQLHPVRDVVAGLFFYPVERAGDVLDFYRSYIDTAPEEMGAYPAFHLAPPLPFIPPEEHGRPFSVIIACWSGPADRAERALEPIRRAAPIVAEHVDTVPYPAMNTLFDELLPPGLQHYWKTAFATELTDGAIRAHLEYGPRVPAVNTAVHLYPINGACHRVPSDATAFAYRDARFATVIAGMWPDPADNAANTAWVRDYYRALEPHSTGGGYVNFMADDDQARVHDSYRDNYARLAAVKRAYDPDNLFHLNQNIPPAD
ncbi:FAD-binding oxidoreductase [Gandjariella thermophila]|uniref:Oxidoreductase n=1 Tax=Gandjariella thermophila TaxID=1931992 RepID=A0A4D4JAH2_9PSEU|nr:FAD-binding oxidoreductase [Gandjariella thermophila]GDY32322.1 oxidoreductase [Gandjariella thermophila]